MYSELLVVDSSEWWGPPPSLLRGHAKQQTVFSLLLLPLCFVLLSLSPLNLFVFATAKIETPHVPSEAHVMV